MKIAIVPQSDFDIGWAHAVAKQLTSLADVVVLSGFTPVATLVNSAFEAHDYVFVVDAADGRGGTVTQHFYRGVKSPTRLSVAAVRTLLKGE